MKIADYRYQTTAPDSPGSSVKGVYANSNGFLVTKSSAGVELLIGTEYSGVLPNTAIRTGTASFLLTGTYFTTAQGELFGTGLGCPAAWVPVRYNSTNYALPLYALQP